MYFLIRHACVILDLADLGWAQMGLAPSCGLCHLGQCHRFVIFLAPDATCGKRKESKRLTT